MKSLFHPDSVRYALALWLATVLALFVAFLVQLEPAQWSAITVWIIFVQNPRMNYSKIIWWIFGTVTGALMATILIVCFNQAPELFLFGLALWLAGCAAAATFVTSYRAYGGVLAGYTCAIVSMSASDHPDLIFRLAMTRVSCIFIGMASAIVMIIILLPKHRHWRETRHHLTEHLKATLLQAAKGLRPDLSQPVNFTWRHIVDRLSTLEHTLDMTTAESADSRIHAPQARSLVATLFDLLAKAQAVEVHLSRPNATRPAAAIEALLISANTLLTQFAQGIDETKIAWIDQIARLRNEVTAVRETVRGPATDEMISNWFLLDRLDDVLEEFSWAAQDWRGLFGPWTARRASHLAVHRDYRTAGIYGLRMFLAMSMGSVLWFVTQWPSGSQFILFLAVVCSLLSLLDEATLLGSPFLKSAVFCAIMAYIETFWLFQTGQGFLILALMLGVFLLPAAYAYRHPRLVGGAVVSMLIFYGLSMPANQMTYDIAAFLNNGAALLCAAGCGFFAFHAVPSLNSGARQFWLLRAVRHDLARGERTEQKWTSRMFDRLRLLHRAAEGETGTTDLLEAENEMLLSLQLGLRQQRLSAHLEQGAVRHDAAEIVAGALKEFRKISRHPSIVALVLRSACARFQEMLSQEEKASESTLGALSEMREMTLLLETSTRFYNV